jgi:hypothetical protein
MVALGIRGPRPSHGCSLSQVRAVSELSALATSWRAPRVPGRLLFASVPVPVPAPAAVLGGGGAIQYPSLALFAERVSAVVRVAIITDNQPAVLVTGAFS